MENLFELIENIILEQTKYLRTYTGKVVELDDSTNTNQTDKIGKVKCTIYELGWITNDKAPWCYPNDKNSLLSPKVGDYVRIGFMNGSIDRPYYSGIIGEFEKMIPDNYTDHNDQILFESTDKKLYIKYNEKNQEYIFEHENGNKITIDKNGYLKEDKNGNKSTWDKNGRIEEDKNGNKLEMTSTGMKWTDKNSKIIETTSSLLKLLGATEAFVKGNTAKTELDKESANMAALKAAITGWTPAPNDGGAALKTALGTFLGLPTEDYTSILSTTIKGE